jgi:hypothetical protein
VAAKKIKLTEQNKQSRLLFALNYGLQEIQFWENMVFSDEKMFQSTNDGHVRVYRPRGTRFDENYVKALERSGRFSINTWAWISYHGLRICWRIENRFNAQNYVNILEYVMLPSVRQIYPNHFIYQQDNFPVHTAHVVTQWLRNNNTETLPSPAKRPDLNCIENVWGRMAKEC